ncbi:hypothetical protein [Enterococcus cecorum]|uniref:hypothetical protein n=1 Tax=Enterococcus cecorum TaxID=44008 RepID=UPI00148DAF5C|nr:hypothetical protein [Enterococcus cecorum]
MSEKLEKLTIEEYNLYLKAAIKNLGGGNALYENLSSELKRLAKLYTYRRSQKERIWFLEMIKRTIPNRPFFIYSFFLSIPNIIMTIAKAV